MRIQIHTLAAGIIYLEIDPLEKTIEIIKQKIEEETSIPQDQQLLFQKDETNFLLVISHFNVLQS